MTSTTAPSSAPVTSWWYGQGRAVDVARRLESLDTLTPAPAGPAGLITARRDELAVTFVAGLKSPLPHPWRPAESPNEARIPWTDVDPGLPPSPYRGVYLVVFGTSDDGALIALNLAAFQRIRITGDSTTATALVRRWILELLATHTDITIGVTPDLWPAPLTTRVHAVTVGHVPQVDVLVCGPDLTYTDRAHILSHATAKIIVDLGTDAALDTKWAITCGPDQIGQISNGVTRPMTAALILPSAATLERCAELLTDQPSAPQHSSYPANHPHDNTLTAQPGNIGADNTDTETPPPAVGLMTDTSPTDPPAPHRSVENAPHQPPTADHPDDHDTDTPLVHNPVHNIADDPAASVPQIAPVWNRILGQIDLCPPTDTGAPSPREKRLNELTIFLQHNRFATSTEIIRAVYGGAASDKTVTQQVSMLRARLGTVHPGGPKALPPMRDGGYALDPAVRSDWMEFERLVEILIDTTATANLIAAMNLVTGPPLGGVPTREWAWTTDLRDEIRDRVAGCAVTLARRHHGAKKYSAAAETARKGLWYDNARQDLWQVGMRAALDGHDYDAFRALRRQYLSAVAGPDRDPVVFDLTKQAG